MNAAQDILRGVLLPDGTLKLDRPPVMPPPGPVEVVLREAPAGKPAAPGGLMEIIESIRADREARGHVFRTAEEIDAEIRELREGWELSP